MVRLKSAAVCEAWREQLQRYQQTNLTVAAFCEWEGVSPAAFYLWRKKLAAGTEMTPRQPSARYQAQDRPVPGFVQILPEVSPALCASERVVMTLVDGTRVELPATDHDLIARVVLSVSTGHSAAMPHGGNR
jgi:hypothetical protein